MALSEPRTPNPSDELEALRRLLLQPEQDALEELLSPGEKVRQLAEHLPEGMSRRAREDKALQNTLAPILEEVLPILVRRNPKLLAEILYPVMLPAIRRAVASMFASLVQGFNQTLDQVFSPRGIRWRLEALTTGKPFGEVVLSHTLLYQVEQVLLIQRDSGLLLVHSVAEGVKVQDGAMVSGMLTAIGDFVHDSFDPEAGLNTVDFGERKLVVEPGPLAVLAAVVKGSPPEELKGRLQDMLSLIHVQFNEDLGEFGGDPAIFDPAKPLLEELLEARYQTQAHASTKRPPYFLIALGLILLAGLGWWGWNNYQAGRAWNTYLERLQTASGIVVTESSKRYVLRGLRDPLAPDPLSFAEGIDLPTDRIRAKWEPYQSFEPEIVLKRIKVLLNTPDTVQLSWQNGVLMASGTAPLEWIQRLKTLAAAFGVERLQYRIIPQ